MIDRAFIDERTHGFEEFEACVRGHKWAALEIGGERKIRRGEFDG